MWSQALSQKKTIWPCWSEHKFNPCQHWELWVMLRTCFAFKQCLTKWDSIPTGSRMFARLKDVLYGFRISDVSFFTVHFNCFSRVWAMLLTLKVCVRSKCLGISAVSLCKEKNGCESQDLFSVLDAFVFLIFKSIRMFACWLMVFIIFCNNSSHC